MPKRKSDPKGHSLRIYDYIFDSPAFAALSPYDVMAYLALLRELRQFNNGDLSLPLSRAKKHGIKHHVTLAKSLRALCAVGLIAVTRRGGCTKGGQRLPNLYRLTDRECYAIPAKYLEALNETNEWRKVATKKQGLELIESAELAAKAKAQKLKSASHVVTITESRLDLVRAEIASSDEVWIPELRQDVTYGKKSANPVTVGPASDLYVCPEKLSHRTPHVSPLYVATPIGCLGSATDSSSYQWRSDQPKDAYVALASDCVDDRNCNDLGNLQRKISHVANDLREKILVRVSIDDLT